MSNIQSPFNWVNVLAVPMAAGILEAQPVVAISTLVALVFSGQREALLVAEGSSILLIWSLYWWALLIRQVVQPRRGERWANLFSFPAFLVSLVLIVVTYPGLFHATISLLYALGLSVYLWRRGMLRVEKDLQGESGMASFHIGFVLLLFALLFTMLDPQSSAQSLLTMLPCVLMVFCLSGLTMLSLKHLGTMRTAHRHRCGKGRTNPTRLWIQTLFGLLGALAALMLVLVAAVFQPLMALFLPLSNVLRTVINRLSGLFRSTFVPNCLYQTCPTPQGPSSYSTTSPDLPFTLIQMIRTVGMSLLGCFALGILFWIIWRALCGRKSGQNEDEVREHLPIRPTLKARRQNTKERQLERLDATSARFYYRAFLLAMARRGKDEQRRHLDETPNEYQARLLAQARPDAQKDTTPAEAAILDALTRAYTQERYGGKTPTVSQQAYLRKWISLLVKRLTSS